MEVGTHFSVRNTTQHDSGPDLLPRRYVVVGPDRHGVVSHALRLGAADSRLSASLLRVRFPRSGVRPRGLVESIPPGSAVMLQATDRLLGSSPEEAARVVGAVSRTGQDRSGVARPPPAGRGHRLVPTAPGRLRRHDRRRPTWSSSPASTNGSASSVVAVRPTSPPCERDGSSSSRSRSTPASAIPYRKASRRTRSEFWAFSTPARVWTRSWRPPPGFVALVGRSGSPASAPPPRGTPSMRRSWWPELGGPAFRSESPGSSRTTSSVTTADRGRAGGTAPAHLRVGIDQRVARGRAAADHPPQPVCARARRSPAAGPAPGRRPRDGHHRRPRPSRTDMAGL